MPSPSKDQPEPDVLELLDQQLARYQDVIKRLAGNGVQVKTWCVTVVAAVATLATNNHRPGLLVVGLVAALGFFFLDAYYLSLERHFRRAADDVVDDLAAGRETGWTAFFKLEPPTAPTRFKPIFAATGSLAVSPFYALVAGVLVAGLMMSRL